MDQDADNKRTAGRLDKIEGFLDRVEPSWRDDQGWRPGRRSGPQDLSDVADQAAAPAPGAARAPAMAVTAGADGTYSHSTAPKSEGLVEDDEQTKRDREALGLEPLPHHRPDQYGGDQKPGETGEGQDEGDLTDREGKVWRRDARADEPDRWVTGEGDSKQEFVGTRDELKSVAGETVEE